MFDLLGLKIKPAFDGTNPEFEMPKWASPRDFPRTFSVFSTESCAAASYPLDSPLVDFHRLRFSQFAADFRSLLSPRPNAVPKLIRQCLHRERQQSIELSGLRLKCGATRGAAAAFSATASN